MPRKKHFLTDAERAKRIRETARDLGTRQRPEGLERAFKKSCPDFKASHAAFLLSHSSLAAVRPSS